MLSCKTPAAIGWCFYFIEPGSSTTIGLCLRRTLVQQHYMQQFRAQSSLYLFLLLQVIGQPCEILH